MADLIVELYGHRVGLLRGSDWRTFDFVIDPNAFEHFELGSRVMSESVPFDAVPVQKPLHPPFSRWLNDSRSQL